MMIVKDKYFRKGITVFELEFYSTEDGKEPVAEFLDSLDSKMNAKLIGLMELLETWPAHSRDYYYKDGHDT